MKEVALSLKWKEHRSLMCNLELKLSKEAIVDMERHLMERIIMHKQLLIQVITWIAWFNNQMIFRSDQANKHQLRLIIRKDPSHKCKVNFKTIRILLLSKKDLIQKEIVDLNLILMEIHLLLNCRKLEELIKITPKTKFLVNWTMLINLHQAHRIQDQSLTHALVNHKCFPHQQLSLQNHWTIRFPNHKWLNLCIPTIQQTQNKCTQIVSQNSLLLLKQVNHLQIQTNKTKMLGLQYPISVAWNIVIFLL